MGLYRTVVFAAILLLVVPSPTDARQPGSLLEPFRSVTGELNSERTTQIWEFNGRTGQTISLIAQTINGDLDTVIELYDTQRRLMAANDNESFDSTLARIEGITLPATGSYLVQVYREGLEFGTTSGTYQLTLLHGFSNYTSLDAITRIIQLDPGMATVERRLATIPAPSFYTTLQLVVPQTDSPYQLEWRFYQSETASLTWIFHHNNSGDWSLTAAGPRDSIIRSARGNSPAFNFSPGDEIGFSFWFHDRTFWIAVDDQIVTSLVLALSAPSATAGDMTITLESSQDNTSALVIPVHDLYMTTAFYTQQPVTLGAIGPAAPGERLYSYSNTPLEIINELRNLEYIPPTGGGIVGNIPTGYIQSDNAGFTAIPLIERPFENFVIGYTATLVEGASATACGIILRQEDSANFATVLHTPERGIYFLQYQNGLAAEDGITAFNPAVLPGIGVENRVIIIALDNQGWLFMNGRLIGTVPLNPSPGPTLAHIALPIDESAYCQFDDFWIWSFN